MQSVSAKHEHPKPVTMFVPSVTRSISQQSMRNPKTTTAQYYAQVMVGVVWIFGARCDWAEHMEEEMLLWYVLYTVCAKWLDGIALDDWDDPFYDNLEEILEKIRTHVEEP